MSNFDLRDGLSGIATEVRGVDLYDRALRRSAQIRRRRAAAAVLATAVAVVAISGATWRLAGDWAHPPMPGDSTTSTPPTTTPTTPAPTVSEPDPDILNTTLALPVWPAAAPDLGVGDCPVGPISVVDGLYFDDASGTTIGMSAPAILDLGDVTHYVVSVSCGGPGQGGHGQVLAYRLEGTEFTFVGRVVDTSVVTRSEGAWPFIMGVRADGDRSVIVELMVRLSVGTWPPEFTELTQERTYDWDGEQYRQSAGPTSFLTDADVSMTASDLVFGPAVEFCREGTITLTITNNEPSPLPRVDVALILPGLGESAVTACQRELPGQGRDSALVTMPDLAPGETRTVTATVVVDTRSTTDDATRFDGRPENYYADLRVGSQRTGETVPIVIRY